MLKREDMGADRVTLFYGIRFQVTDSEEISLLNVRKHPLVKTAKKHGLDHYWGNFGQDGNDFTLLYIGRDLGEFGHEGKFETEISDDEFAKIRRDTAKRIKEAGFSLVPALFVQFEPDV